MVVTPDATVIDGRGKYLIPGLWDMHTHSWDADLVLLEANPLEDIGNVQRIAAVFLNGRYLDRQDLDALLAGAAKAAAASQN